MNTDKITIHSFVEDSLIMRADKAMASPLLENILLDAIADYQQRMKDGDGDGDGDEDGDEDAYEDAYLEIMQFWYINGSLSDLLSESEGNIIINELEHLDGIVWCRTCCGQSIYMDDEIKAAFETIQARFPNEYEALEA